MQLRLSEEQKPHRELGGHSLCCSDPCRPSFPAQTRRISGPAGSSSQHGNHWLPLPATCRTRLRSPGAAPRCRWPPGTHRCSCCLSGHTHRTGEKKKNHCIFQNVLFKQRVTTPRQLGEVKRQGCLLLGWDGAGDNPKGAEQPAQHLKLTERGQAEQGRSGRAELDIQPNQQLPDPTPSAGKCPMDKYFKLLNLTFTGLLEAVSNADNSY